MSGVPLISVLTMTPLIGALALLVLGRDDKHRARWLALGFSGIALLETLVLWARFNSASGQLQLIERRMWIPTLDISYFVGVDGLGMLMLLLTALVVPMALLAAWRTERDATVYLALILFLQAGLFGTFTALNFFHWFIFWELSLVPAFFLIRLYGGPQRSWAATQFFIYTMVGSVAMLLAFLAIFLATGTFDFVRLAELARDGQLAPAISARLNWPGVTGDQALLVIFAGVLLGFAVKVPLMPLHTWLPPAYAEAPASTTMLLTGLMSKMGVYGFLRVLLPIFPDQTRHLATPLLWLAVITIIFSAFAALAQRDLKRMLAYSSINHLGYCLLGLFAAMRLTENNPQWAIEKAAALNGVMLQMFNHGLTAAALFAFVGLLEQRSGGLRGLDDFGGLRKVMPIFCGLMGLALFSSLGLPGLNGFVGEFLIFKGVFPLAAWAAALSTIGLLVTAVFILIILQRVFSGPLNERWANMPDLNVGELAMMAPAIGLMFLLGVYPQLAIGIFNRTVVRMVEQFGF
jgi:NADH-quinone oxidoreductase subunit M